MSHHEHAAPLWVIECGLHHEQLYGLGRVTRQELDQGLPERTASLGGGGRSVNHVHDTQRCVDNLKKVFFKWTEKEVEGNYNSGVDGEEE